MGDLCSNWKEEDVKKKDDRCLCRCKLLKSINIFVPPKLKQRAYAASDPLPVAF